MSEANTLPFVTSSFSVSGDRLQPDAVTKAIGIEPTETGLKGTKRRPESPVLLQRSFWAVELEKERIDDIDSGLSRLLDIVWPQRKHVKEFLRLTGFEAGFSTTVTIRACRPLYCLRGPTLRRIAYFDIPFVIDIFDYSE